MSETVQLSVSAKVDEALNVWHAKEKCALQLIGIVGDLWYEHSIELVLFRETLVDKGVGELLNLHLRAREVVKCDLVVDVTLKLAKAIQDAKLAPAKIDLGRLGAEWLKLGTSAMGPTEFINDKLKDFKGDGYELAPKDVVLFGFGRIGRIAARLLINQTGKGQQLRLKGIVVRKAELKKRAELLRNDSVHGPFKGVIIENYDTNELIVNGQTIKFIEGVDPAAIDYTTYGIHDALLIDNTGAFRDREGLSKHLLAKGVSQVLLTAPGKGDLPNIVHAVNQHIITDEDVVISAASCTTNAIVPTLKVVNDAIGIESGHIETVHSYTNDQNLLDNIHKSQRRGRSAALNLVITETGAGKAAAKALPELAGKLTGNAVRVPTPNVSLAILKLNLAKPVTKESINQLIKDASLSGNLVEQLQFSENDELVSSDVIGSIHAGVVDGPSTIVGTDGKSVVLYVWYDNEYGYTCQVLRLSKHFAKVRRPTYY
ncbi:MAG: glyceraldehyde-3-phosphate dehydrogenase [Bacteroidetes bacterium]|jgi:glyceraldehyde 3-phosphate dehydrogenase|nr:glyceraldehyde-3-phosphate dehydrogenase [Bacteroidota bacterium]